MLNDQQNLKRVFLEMNSQDRKEFKRLQKCKLKSQAAGKLKEEAEICNVLGELLSKYGEYEDAIKEHQQELQLSESVQDVIGKAVANRKIGECYSQLGHYKKALRHQGRHLELARSVDSYVEEQRAHATIGRTYLFQGENIKQSDPDEAQVALHKARESFFKSLEVCGHLKGVVSERELMEMKARLYLNIGLVYDNQGDNVNSAKFIKQAVFIAEKHNLSEDLYRSHCSQGDIYYRMGESTKALRSFENAMKVAKKLKEKNWESDALSVSANVLFQLGDFTAAKRALKKAYKLGSGKAEERDIVVRTLKATIRACRLQEELDDTSDVAYRERLPLYEALGDLCSKISVFTLAAVYYKKQLSCAMALQCGPKELIPIYISLATTYADDGQHKKAIEMYRKELELRKGHPKEEGRTWLNIADAQEKSHHDFEAVSQSYKNAVECAKKAQHSKLQLLSLRSLSLLHKKAKQELLYGATMEKIHRLKEKYDIASDDEDELSEDDEGEGTGQEMDSESWEMDNLDLSDSDVSDVEEEYDRSSATVRARKSKFAKRNEKGETLLHRACIDGNLRQVKKLLLQGHPVNPRDYCGWIPLHEACNFGHLGIVEALLEHGADISDRGGEGCSGITPLHDAINGGNFEVAELLVARGASVQAKDDKGMNALDTMQNWMETYAGDLDQSTRQDAERMSKTIQQVQKHGNHRSVPARPRNILENTDLFDREESRSQDISRQSQASTSYHNNHHHHHSRDNNRKQTSSGRDVASARCKQQSHVARNGSTLLQRNIRRSDCRDEEEESDDADHFETLRGAESENYSDEPMDITQDSLPFMTSHIRTRLVAEKLSTTNKEEKTMEGDDLFVESKILADDDVLQIDDIEVDENVYSSQNEPPVTENARQTYISALSSVGSAATRLSLNPVPVNTAKTKPTNETPALIPEEEYTGGDDWLIEDIATQPNKRKRMDLDYMMGNNTKAQSTSALSGPSGSQLRASQKSLSLSRKSKRSRQMKLTNMGASVVSRQAREGSRVPSPLFEEDSRPDSDTDFSPVQEVDEEPPTTRHLDSTRVERPPAPDHHPGPGGAVMRVRVKIQDKTFLIPIREATNNMSWLCEEAARRHFASCGLRPKLQLCTGEGAMFSPDDVIADLLNNNEEVIGKVEAWDLPPLTERYKRACQNAKTVEHPKILSHLQQSQSTPATLELNSLALRAPHLKPLFLALQCQYSLRKLILPGNRISDAAVATLTSALKSLPNLSILDLSCNGISQEGLKLLQEGLTERNIGGEHVGPAALGQSSSKPAELLEELNLSYNPLTDACAPYLAALIQHCSLLSNLNLTSCDLTTKLFQLHRRALTEAFQGANNLRTLHISHNALGSTGVELLLRCLSSEVVSSLDLSCVIVSSAGSNLAKHLVAYLSLPDCSLKELRLSGCQLGDQDIFDINRCLPARSQLTTLDLSSNANITEASICQLFQVTAKSQAPLESLDLSGCGFQTPFSTDFLASLSLNLVQDGHKRAPLKGLRMCGNKLSKGDCELLIGVWEEAHGSVAMHHVDSTRCVLYVRD